MEREGHSFREGFPSNPMLIFPSRTRRYVRLTAEEAYKSVLSLVQEASSGKIDEAKEGKNLSMNARLGWIVGAKVNVKVLPEGEVSALDFTFSYQRFFLAVIAVLFGTIGTGVIIHAVIGGLVAAIIVPLAYAVNGSVNMFLNSINETMPYIEQESARRALIEDRKRWKDKPKDIDELYRQLAEKHTRSWGNTNVLEYKLKEYQTQGLTRDEAVRKAAEEEGISQ